MDTGLGSKAYSIIEQGKIGQILSTKPADRRAIIEEAAGITKYKARRRQTQLKLEATQQNLLRVNDIVNEVEKQLESLKRQAAKARRWRAARDEMQGVERVVFGRRYRRAQRAGARPRRAARRPRRSASAPPASPSRPRRRRSRSVARPSTSSRRSSRRCAGASASSPSRWIGTRVGAATAASRSRRPRSRIRGGGRARSRSSTRARRPPRGVAHREAGRGGAAPRAARRRRGGAARRRRPRSRRPPPARPRPTPSRRAPARAQVGLLGRIASLQNTRASVSGNAERAEADLLKLAAEREELERERDRGCTAPATRRSSRREEAEALAAELARSRDEAHRPSRRGADPGRAAHPRGRGRCRASATASPDGGPRSRRWWTPTPPSTRECARCSSSPRDSTCAASSPTPWRRPRSTSGRSRASWATASRRCSCPTRTRRCAGSAGSSRRGRGAAPSCPSPPPAPAATARRCGPSRSRSRRRAGCCPTSTA